MDSIHYRLSDKFSSHWIKVKFYDSKPQDKKTRRLAGVKFCQATKEAVLHPVVLDKDSIDCAGAQCAFGWNGAHTDFLETCHT